MFIAGMTSIQEPPVNDVWSVPGEEERLSQWQAEDREAFARVDPTSYYHFLQDADFLAAVAQNRPPAVTGEEGRKTVELFTAIYRSQRDRAPVRFPLSAEDDAGYDGRLAKPITE
jgi:predicted dehydrogenase